MATKRVLFGRERSVPEASGRGDMQDVTRWRVIRDGLAAVIEHLPVGDRGLATRLGEVWAYADSRLDGTGVEQRTWPTLF